MFLRLALLTLALPPDSSKRVALFAVLLWSAFLIVKSIVGSRAPRAVCLNEAVYLPARICEVVLVLRCPKSHPPILLLIVSTSLVPVLALVVVTVLCFYALWFRIRCLLSSMKLRAGVLFPLAASMVYLTTESLLLAPNSTLD